MSIKPSSRQPHRQPWTLETFVRERAYAINNSLDLSTRRTYSSALNSWIAFVNMHDFSVEPTQDTLSFFIVYMSHHIEPRSVKSYLSGLVQQLEPNFPNIRNIRSSPLISKVLKGCWKLKSKPIPSHCRPLFPQREISLQTVPWRPFFYCFVIFGLFCVIKTRWHDFPGWSEHPWLAQGLQEKFFTSRAISIFFSLTLSQRR